MPKNFLEEYKEYLAQQKAMSEIDSELFSDSQAKSRKQLENALTIFRELILKRKRKILNLIFVATETGIMKKDYENMLQHEKEIFDSMVKIFENSDTGLSKMLANKEVQIMKNKMILLKQDVEQFLDHTGNFIGPFKSGDLIKLDSSIAQILVEEKKASYVDENN